MFRVKCVEGPEGIEHHGASPEQCARVSRIECNGKYWIFHEHGDEQPEAAPAAAPAVPVADVGAIVAAAVADALAKAGVKPA